VNKVFLDGIQVGFEIFMGRRHAAGPSMARWTIVELTYMRASKYALSPGD
jgi:hypothetical protein